MQKEPLRSFLDLNAWQEGHKLVLAVYEITKSFPSDERFGLVSQMRRAAVSVTSNIAEGFGRKTYRDKHRFYTMASGSLSELLNQIFISRDLFYLDQQSFDRLQTQQVTAHKLVYGLLAKTEMVISARP